jgi:hypothetical protein
MGMDLYRVTDNTYFRWSVDYWPAVLELALHYGWKPISARGEGPTECVCEHVGSYCKNDGRIVTCEDAKAIATALEKALPEVPSEEVIAKKKMNPDLFAGVSFPDEFPRYEIDRCLAASSGGICMIVGGYFTPEVWQTLSCFEKLAVVKPKLKDFVTYLRGGGFEIH